MTGTVQDNKEHITTSVDAVSSAYAVYSGLPTNLQTYIMNHQRQSSSKQMRDRVAAGNLGKGTDDAKLLCTPTGSHGSWYPAGGTETGKGIVYKSRLLKNNIMRSTI